MKLLKKSKSTLGSKIPALNFKRTKILASIGPASNSEACIYKLIKAGANGVRLNFSHGTYEEKAKHIKWARAASKALGKPVAVVQDLQGPKIRVGDLPEKVELLEGQKVLFGYNVDYDEKGIIPVQYDLSIRVKAGEIIYLHDGKIQARVQRVHNGIVAAQVEVGGVLISRRGINLPDTDLGGDILTHKDLEDLRWGLKHDVDFVAISFVQKSEDVKHAREYLKRIGSDAKLITKIETKAALEDLEAIVKASDGVMVARGDLATEAGPEVVPIVQRQIIGLCRRYGKFAIVATQMLISMLHNPEPSRAEVSDVATAVILGTDCMMLSDETNSGEYPVEAVAMMKKIILYTEKHNPVQPVYDNTEENTKDSALASAVITLAQQVGAKVIITETRTGKTARNISRHRPTMPIVMATNDVRVAQQLALRYGGKSMYFKTAEKAGAKSIQTLVKAGHLKKGDYYVMAYGTKGIAGSTNTIKVEAV